MASQCNICGRRITLGEPAFTPGLCNECKARMQMQESIKAANAERMAAVRASRKS